MVVMMLAGPKSRVDVIKAAWAHRIPNFYFAGVCEACTVRTPPQHESWDNLPPKVFEMFSAATKMFPEAQLFVKLDTDTYVNYLALLLALDEHQQKHGELPPYFGSVYSLGGHPGFRYCSGGAGYVLRRDAASSFWKDGAIINPPSPYEDAAVGFVLRDRKLAPVHHIGFLGDKVEEALKHWLDHSLYDNHWPDATVPRMFITMHGYKDPWALLTIAMVAQSSAAEWAWMYNEPNVNVGVNQTVTTLPFVKRGEGNSAEGIPPLLAAPVPN